MKAAAAPPHCARYLARRAPYSYSRVMKQVGRRAPQGSQPPPVHNSARPQILVVNNWQLRFDTNGNLRRSGYEHEPTPCDGQGKIFEPERCTGDRNEHSRCRPLQASTIRLSQISGSQVPDNTTGE